MCCFFIVISLACWEGDSSLLQGPIGSSATSNFDTAVLGWLFNHLKASFVLARLPSLTPPKLPHGPPLFWIASFPFAFCSMILFFLCSSNQVLEIKVWFYLFTRKWYNANFFLPLFPPPPHPRHDDVMSPVGMMAFLMSVPGLPVRLTPAPPPAVSHRSSKKHNSVKEGRKVFKKGSSHAQMSWGSSSAVAASSSLFAFPLSFLFLISTPLGWFSFEWLWTALPTKEEWLAIEDLGTVSVCLLLLLLLQIS